MASPNIRTLPTAIPEEGVGIVEAMRGILTHHYQTDKNGLVTKANLIVGTTNNNAPISMSIKRAAQKLIQPGKEVGQGLLNMVEMAFRLYDPVFLLRHALASRRNAADYRGNQRRWRSHSPRRPDGLKRIFMSNSHHRLGQLHTHR